MRPGAGRVGHHLVFAEPRRQKGAVSSGVSPVAVNSALDSPKIGAPLKPHVPVDVA